MKVQARQFEKKAENKAVVNSIREAQTFSFEELFTLKNDLLQLTYYLSVELRNSFRSTISFALNEKFIKTLFQNRDQIDGRFHLCQENEI